MRPLSLVALFLLLLVLGCGGSKSPTVNDPPGPDPDPPDAPTSQSPNKPTGAPPKPAIFPRGDIGMPGQVVELLAKQVSPEAAAPQDPKDQIVGFNWHFTNAEPSTSKAPRPKITLKNEGQVEGALTVEMASGQKESYPLWFGVTIMMLPPTIYGLAPESPSGGVGDTITFEALATYMPDQWNWDFGLAAEPSTSTDPSPTITLLTPGTYTGTVTCTNVVGTSTPLHFDYTVLPSSAGIPRITDLVLSNGSGHAEQWGTYHAITNQSLAGYTWDFGGGATPRTAAYSVVPVEFAAAGSYNARVIGHTTEGFDTPPFEFTINVATYPPYIRRVTLDPAVPKVGEPFELHIDSTGSPTEYEIEFSSGGATGPEVEVDYLGPIGGERLVGRSPDPDFTLTAMDDGLLHMVIRTLRASDGTKSAKKNLVLDVRGIPSSTFATELGIRGSIGQPVDWPAPRYADAAFWNFGFGTNPNSSSEISPTTLLQLPGSYTGTLTAFNELGNMEPVTFNYRVGHQWTQPDPALVNGPAVLDVELIADRFRLLTWEWGAGYAYTEAQNTNPSGDGDWGSYPLNVAGESASTTRMLVFQDKPLLITEEPAGSTVRLVAHVPTSASPMSMSDWQRRVMAGIPLGAHVKDVAADSGQVVAAMSMSSVPGICFARSLDATLQNWQWSSINTADPDEVRVTIDDGRLLVAGDQAEGPGLGELRFYEATTSTPIQASDWNAHVITPVPVFEELRCLALVNHRPLVISGTYNSSLGLRLANNTSPQSINDWTMLPTDLIPGVAYASHATQVAVAGNRVLLSPVSVLATEGTGRTEIRAGVLIIDGDLLNSSNYRPELPGFGTELRTHSALFDSDGNIVSLERNSSDGVMVCHEQP